MVPMKIFIFLSLLLAPSLANPGSEEFSIVFNDFVGFHFVEVDLTSIVELSKETNGYLIIEYNFDQLMSYSLFKCGEILFKVSDTPGENYLRGILIEALIEFGKGNCEDEFIFLFSFEQKTTGWFKISVVEYPKEPDTLDWLDKWVSEFIQYKVLIPTFEILFFVLYLHALFL